MMNMMNMMKQAQNIQKKLVEAQEELAKYSEEFKPEKDKETREGTMGYWLLSME